jgi:hypothetical protein
MQMQPEVWTVSLFLPSIHSSRLGHDSLMGYYVLGLVACVELHSPRIDTVPK